MSVYGVALPKECFQWPASATKERRTLEDIAGWTGLVATCVAALMTASNLGARVTGWGFVIFTIGAAAWVVVGIATQQTQLLWSNVFLGMVDIFGIWRWLGRRARFSDTAQAEEAQSERHVGEDLFSVTSLDGMPVKAADGATLAHAVDALAGRTGGGIDHLIVRMGGIGGVGETLHRLPWREVEIDQAEIHTRLDSEALRRLPVAPVTRPRE